MNSLDQSPDSIQTEYLLGFAHLISQAISQLLGSLALFVLH